MKNERWILITGASTGIGRASTEYLATKGFKIFAGARKNGDLKALDKIPNVKSIKLDVTIEADVANAYSTINENGSGLYGLINNAGVNFPGPSMEMTVEELTIPFQVNFMGVHRLTRALFPFILKSKGRIINISSINGFLGLPFNAPYSISKFSIEAYSDSLRRELYPHGVKVSVVEPGIINTGMWKKGENQAEILINTKKDSVFYDEGIKFMNFFKGIGNKEGIPALKIAKALEKALTAKNPKTRYLVTENNLRYWFVKRMPDRLLDLILRKQF
ncbi:MAG: SDR family oxidoreductase [Promethearchaeota archaeon]